MSPSSESPSSRNTDLWLPNDVPHRLGAYELRSLLGKGGMGMVFEARHLLLGQQVAIKVLHPDLPRSDRFVTRFHREIAALGQLSPHPNLVRALYAGEEAGLFYLVMEYVEGQTIERVVRQHGPLAVEFACEIIRQVALGLEVIRKAGLVHRDIKPANLMLDSDGTIKILDLGLVRLREIDPGIPELTGTGVVLGTSNYLAPEQAKDPRKVDIRADIYSLGCTLYQLLTGRAPYSEHHSPASKIHAHAYLPFPPLDRTVHHEVCDLLARMTAKEPEARPASPLDLVKAIASLVQGVQLSPLLKESQAIDAHLAACETVTANRSPDPTVLPPSGFPATSRRSWVFSGWLVATSCALTAIVAAWLYFAHFGSVPLEKVDSSQAGLALAPDGDKTPPNTDPIMAAGDKSPSLDGLTPYESHDLLNQAPVQAVWDRGDGTAFRNYDMNRKQLIVNSPKNSLFHLGTLQAPSFTLQVQIKQTRWTGGAGVYLGFRQVTGEPTASAFQYLRFGEAIGPADKILYTLTRGQGILRVAGNRKVFDWGDRESVNITPPQQEAWLILEIVRHRLFKVRLNGVELEGLTRATADPYFTPADFQGCIGLSNSANSCVFHKASLTIVPER